MHEPMLGRYNTVQYCIVRKYQGTIWYNTKCVLSWKVEYNMVILWTFETEIKCDTLEISLNDNVVLNILALLSVSIIKKWGNNLLHSYKIGYSYQNVILLKNILFFLEYCLESM